MSLSKKFVEITDVGMTFETAKGNFTALRNIDLTIEQGEFITLIGHSGCGKSTLLNLIAGLTLPTTGHLICAGREIAGPGPDRGVVFQNHSLLPWLTCYGNVYLAVERVFAETENKAQLKARTDAALALVGLTHAADKRPQEISGGMKQRVGIARAIVHRPALLLADEPTGNLDPRLAAEIMGVFEDINRLGTSVLIASHDLALIARMRHRMLTLQRGRLIGDGEAS